MKKIKGSITSPKGFKAAGIACGLKKSGKKDLAVIYSEVPCSAAAVFTTNKFKAAPIIVSQKQVRSGIAQAIVANSGNANAATGKQGITDAWEMVDVAAHALGIPKKSVLVTSTGVIGHLLPMDKIVKGINQAAGLISKDGGVDAAHSILTTDTTEKQITLKVGKYTVSGIAKGSGMICPTMATMHAFITTDARVSPAVLKECLKRANEISFNMLSVDNCMSTNDCVFVLANGLSGQEIRGAELEQGFKEALEHVCIYLAKAIARDGEGATKLIEAKVAGAKTQKDACCAAKMVINSDLFKAAIFGKDLNWGRIVAAVGACNISFNPDKVDVFAEGIQIVKNGAGIDVSRAQANKVFKKKDIIFRIDLKEGKYSAQAWGCDLSYDYVKINARYHT